MPASRLAPYPWGNTDSLTGKPGHDANVNGQRPAHEARALLAVGAEQKPGLSCKGCPGAQVGTAVP